MMPYEGLFAPAAHDDAGACISMVLKLVKRLLGKITPASFILKLDICQACMVSQRLVTYK